MAKARMKNVKEQSAAEKASVDQQSMPANNKTASSFEEAPQDELVDDVAGLELD